MHVEVIGQGPPLVLLHGWGMHAGIFAPLARRLRERFTLHLVDLPGHGASAAADARLELASCATAIAAAVPPAPWLGWSLGGLVALAAAGQPRSAVQGLVMVCAAPRFVRAPDWEHGVDPQLFSSFARELGRDYRGTVQRFLALESLGSAHAIEELRGLRAQVFARGEPTPQALADGLDVLAGSDLRALLPRLPVPSLWLAGRRDRLVDWRAMQAAAALAPRSQFRRLEGGHLPFLGQADVVADVVAAFAAHLPA